MDEWLNYDRFDRETWHSFFPYGKTFLTQETLMILNRSMTRSRWRMYVRSICL
jgi:hypothetical protein